jgi:hypothetical protein
MREVVALPKETSHSLMELWSALLPLKSIKTGIDMANVCAATAAEIGAENVL